MFLRSDMPTPEGKIQTAVCEYLAKRGVFFFRTNNQPVFDRKLNNGYGAYRSQGKWSAPGLSDIIAITPPAGKYGGGVFVGLEIKTPRGKQSADQILFAKRCALNNAEYHVIRSLDDVKKLDYLWG